MLSPTCDLLPEAITDDGRSCRTRFPEAILATWKTNEIHQALGQLERVRRHSRWRQTRPGSRGMASLAMPAVLVHGRSQAAERFARSRSADLEAAVGQQRHETAGIPVDPATRSRRDVQQACAPHVPIVGPQGCRHMPAIARVPAKATSACLAADNYGESTRALTIVDAGQPANASTPRNARSFPW